MKANKEEIMQARFFIEKLQNIYNNQYNKEQIETIIDKTKNYSSKALDHAIDSLIGKYKTLPSVPNVLEYCEKGQSEHPNIVKNRKNNLTPENFKVSQAVYNGWFSELKIQINGHKCTITPRDNISDGKPCKIFENWIMTHLKENLVYGIGDNIELIEWDYLGHYRNKTYKKENNFE